MLAVSISFRGDYIVLAFMAPAGYWQNPAGSCVSTRQSSAIYPAVESIRPRYSCCNYAPSRASTRALARARELVPTARWLVVIYQRFIDTAEAATKTSFVIGLSTPIILPSTNLPLPPDSSAELTLWLLGRPPQTMSVPRGTCSKHSPLASSERKRERIGGV